jgi:signal transduction histidine kinase
MRLQQVFWNLLKNASKFTPDGGAIRVTSRNEPGRVLVEIADNGVGFELHDAERIFDAFAQANRAVTREFGGLGLGLAISKATVDAHGGMLRATSPGPGKGATFTVELPLGHP